MWLKRACSALLVLFLFPTCVRGFAVTARATARRSNAGITQPTRAQRRPSLRSTATPSIVTGDGKTSTDAPYSPLDLVEALRDASEHSRSLGVEKIFLAMSNHQGFMNEVRICHVKVKFLTAQLRRSDIFVHTGYVCLCFHVVSLGPTVLSSEMVDIL